MTVSTKGTAMGRIAKVLNAGVAAAGLLLGTAGVAQADEQSYLDQLNETGAANVYSSSANRLTIGRKICDNIRLDGDPRAGFNYVTNAKVSQQLIDIAQHELCPDTIGSAQ
ncbi:DUF732 domain-containing protein [Mycolicibacter heraklionensis]|uniref:DUF732 domain-containing protein n=1 Tax=Mycolicibacter heraklionensis TaxID=512402 RepID=A0A9X7ZIJ4_9MYCO|nr:DUF732 domain-containing protein [Mycolicibacter heraklionensis]QZA09622.1 DUF732 domain-containing protein [Mycolicibacter heraklionensis]